VLYKPDNPDRYLIDKKIDKLSRLEFQLNERLEDVERRR